MKGILRILVSVAAVALTLTLVTGSGLSEAWAKGSGGSHGTTSGITQSGNTQGSPAGGNVSGSDSASGKKNKPPAIKFDGVDGEAKDIDHKGY